MSKEKYIYIARKVEKEITSSEFYKQRQDLIHQFIYLDNLIDILNPDYIGDFQHFIISSVPKFLKKEIISQHIYQANKPSLISASLVIVEETKHAECEEKADYLVYKLLSEIDQISRIQYGAIVLTPNVTHAFVVLNSNFVLDCFLGIYCPLEKYFENPQLVTYFQALSESNQLPNLENYFQEITIEERFGISFSLTKEQVFQILSFEMPLIKQKNKEVIAKGVQLINHTKALNKNTFTISPILELLKPFFIKELMRNPNFNLSQSKVCELVEKKFKIFQSIEVKRIPFNFFCEILKEDPYVGLLKEARKIISEESILSFREIFDLLTRKQYEKAFIKICSSPSPQALPLLKLLFTYQETLEFSIDVNRQVGKDLRTALHYAALNNPSIYEFLIMEKQADPYLKSKEGDSPETLHEYKMQLRVLSGYVN